MNRTIFIMIQAVSWFTTGAALAPLFINQAGVYVGESTIATALGLGLAVAVTSIIQACLTLAWVRFHENPWRRPVTLLAGIAMSLTSGVFAGASWTTFTESTIVERRIHQRETGKATAPLWRFSEIQAGVAAEAETLATVADDKKRIEETEGGSCAGDRKVKLCGPKCRLRQRQATLFDQIAVEARTLSDEATGIAGRFGRGADDEALTLAFVDARRLAGGPMRARMITRLQGQLRGFSEGWRDPGADGVFICRDPEMVTAINDLIAAVDTEVVFPDTPPSRVELQFLDSLEVATGKMMSLALRAVTGAADESDLENDVAYGLAIGIAIELLIIWLIALDMGLRREEGSLRGPLDCRLCSARPMKPNQRADYQLILDSLRSMSLSAGGVEFLAVPIDGDPAAAARIAAIAERLGLPPHRHAGDGVDLAAIKPAWVAARDALHGGARRFRLFKITAAVRAWRRTAAQDLAAGEPGEEERDS